jgi:hypothetical protein
MEPMFQRFAEQAPVAVVARLGLQRAIGAEWVDEVFARHRGGAQTGGRRTRGVDVLRGG